MADSQDSKLPTRAAGNDNGKQPDEEEVRKHVAELEAELRQKEEIAESLRRATTFTIGVDLSPALATIDFSAISFDALLWQRLDPTDAWREAFRRVHHREATWSDYMFPGFGLFPPANGESVVAASEQSNHVPDALEGINDPSKVNHHDGGDVGQVSVIGSIDTLPGAHSSTLDAQKHDPPADKGSGGSTAQEPTESPLASETCACDSNHASVGQSAGRLVLQATAELRAGDGSAVETVQGPKQDPRSATSEISWGAKASKQARALTVAKLINELNILKPQMFEDESEYGRLRVQHPDFLTFKIADDRPDLKFKVIAIQGSPRHIRLAQELAGAHHGRELSTIQDDWKDFKPAEFKRSQ